MNIVVLVGSYYPNYSAVGICARNIVDILKSKHKVTVVANKKTMMDTDFRIDGVDLKYISSRIIDYQIRLDEKMKQDLSSFRYIYKLGRVCLKLLRFVNILISPVSVRRKFVSAYYKALISIGKRESIDLILPFVFPVESLVAGYEYHNAFRQAKIIPVIFDNFVENPSLHRVGINRLLKKKRHVKLLDTIFGVCEKILVMHTQKSYFTKNHDSVLDKTHFIEHPLLIPPQYENTKKQGVSFLYTGSFLKGYVEAGGLISALTEILEKYDYKVDFFVMGNALSPITEFVAAFPLQVFNHGCVAMETALFEMSKADFFLCVAEFSGIQMSSKIFTYMSYGKPIILIYYAEEDINVRILKKYSLFFPLKSDKKGRIDRKDIDSLIRFVERTKSKIISFEDVAMTYNDALPSTTCDLILS